MNINVRRRLGSMAAGIGVIALVGCSRAPADTKAGVQDIQQLMTQYFTSIDRADTAMAERIFSDAPEV